MVGDRIDWNASVVRSYLELEAYLATPHVHPGGCSATSYMLSAMQLADDRRGLDLGCGTGATVKAAAELGADVIAFELMPAMIAATRHRCPGVPAVRGDASKPLPFADETFDSVWGESVVALLDPLRVIPEVVRVVRVGGRVAFNERIWKPDVTVSRAEATNRLSQRCFGIPAAATIPLDRKGWVSLIEQSGVSLLDVRPVDQIAQGAASRGRRDFLRRQIRYLSSPKLLAASLRWRWLIRRHQHEWSQLESWTFIGERTS